MPEVPMTVAVQEKVVRIKKILEVWERISRRLPSTYPKASLVFHSSSADLEEYFFAFYEYSQEEREKGYPPYAFCDANTNTIHVHADMADGTAKEIAGYLLHEEGHLRAFQRYGDGDPRANDKDNRIDERHANRFAARWLRRLRAEGWFA
jgi:hypothetical protein